MEDSARKVCLDMAARIPKPFDAAAVLAKHPIRYEESMSTVLIQECIRYNGLLNVIHDSLSNLLKALKGLVVMSSQYEAMLQSIHSNQVPSMWEAKAYPSLKPLASWVTDLIQRCEFLSRWVDEDMPAAFWISGFYFPQAFLTGTLQNFARRNAVSIDTLSFGFEILDEVPLDTKEGPTQGCYIYGLFLEGARYNVKTKTLDESNPKELYTDMPIIWLRPEYNRVPPSTPVYKSPVYKTLTRAGTLSTTGHSTNFVMKIEVPTDTP